MILCKRKIFLFYIFLIITLPKLFGQDPHFSQFYANPLYLNPAFAGTANCPRFSINFRDQWPSFPNNYLVFSGSYDQHIPVLHGGIGVLVSGNIAGKGFLQTYNAGVMYNFRVQAADKFYMQFALQGSLLHSIINGEKWIFATDIINPAAPPDFPDEMNNRFAKSQFDAGFGFMGYSPYLYFGLAVHHLLPLQINLTNENEKVWQPKWSAHVGGRIAIRQKVRSEENIGDIFLHPNIIFISQGKFNYLHEGFYFNFYPLTIGAWLRHNFKNMDALIVSCGVEYKNFRVGYSYDFNLTKLEGTGGSHEVSLQFTIPCDMDKMGNVSRKKGVKHVQLPCPKF